MEQYQRNAAAVCCTDRINNKASYIHIKKTAGQLFCSAVLSVLIK